MPVHAAFSRSLLKVLKVIIVGVPLLEHLALLSGRSPRERPAAPCQLSVESRH
jgi:hypothetical protein